VWPDAVGASTSELGDLTHSAVFLVGVLLGVWLTFRVFKAVRDEMKGPKRDDEE
jgi:hypothetical protein